MAKLEAVGLLMPTLPIVVVPHPLMTRSPEELRAIASDLLPSVVDAALEGSSDR